MAYALPRRVVRLDHVQRDDTPGMAGEKLWDIAVLGGGIVQEIEGEPVSALGLGLEGQAELDRTANHAPLGLLDPPPALKDAAHREIGDHAIVPAGAAHCSGRTERFSARLICQPVARAVMNIGARLYRGG